MYMDGINFIHVLLNKLSNRLIIICIFLSFSATDFEKWTEFG